MHLKINTMSLDINFSAIFLLQNRHERETWKMWKKYLNLLMYFSSPVPRYVDDKSRKHEAYCFWSWWPVLLLGLQGEGRGGGGKLHEGCVCLLLADQYFLNRAVYPPPNCWWYFSCPHPIFVCSLASCHTFCNGCQLKKMNSPFTQYFMLLWSIEQSEAEQGIV